MKEFIKSKTIVTKALKLAPIALFVYNRPEHTVKTLEALKANTLSDSSELFVFCDGPKIGADTATLEAIEQVRNLVKEKKWCKEVTVYESNTNLGLADSIVGGVTKILNEFGKIIVLEDDIVTAKGFLRYMNEALNCYEKDEKVMHIGSYLPYTNTCTPLPETFFSRFMSCWGWATWKSSWDKATWDAVALYEQISNPKVRYEFNLEGVLDFHNQLERNISGEVKTWAIMWFTSIFLNKGLCLYPRISLSDNIGLDGSGENCDSQSKSVVLNADQYIAVKPIGIKESNSGKRYLKRFYKYGEDSSGRRRIWRFYITYRYQLIKLIKGIE